MERHIFSEVTKCFPNFVTAVFGLTMRAERVFIHHVVTNRRQIENTREAAVQKALMAAVTKVTKKLNISYTCACTRTRIYV